jgi:dethiobiotin synthetase
MSPAGLFVTGTDTGVGKTRVTCWIARQLRAVGIRAGVCKPAATGAERVGQRWIWPDIQALRAVCPIDVSEEWIGPYCWRLPLAPPVADSFEPPLVGLPAPDLDDFVKALDRWAGNCDVLLVEGTGGLLCPLTRASTIADLAARWGRPVLVVARLGLGTLNHTLLTLEAAERRSLPVCGVLMNASDSTPIDLAGQTNPDALRRFTPLPVWGPVPFHDDPATIPNVITQIDWDQLIRDANRETP